MNIEKGAADRRLAPLGYRSNRSVGIWGGYFSFMI